ncbi:MAG: hypothetical protein IT461_04300 [Planctomycetes bacterium]|nr:hypothetical protein [Planctomycetota bacterium]
MANPTAAEAQFRIEQAAAEAKSGLREISRIEVGEAIRQGDIYVRRLAELPAERGKKTELRQLAPGTTQGSRHCVEGECTVYAPAEEWDRLSGPTIEAHKSILITHPEHAHFALPAGVYQVTYQRDFAQEEIDRVED